MAGVLTLGQWLGGPDNVKVESTFPSSQKTYAYNFGQSIAGWSFSADYQTVVVDTIAYTRDGEPNFSDSRVIGFFPSGNIAGANIVVTNTAQGLVQVTHPANLYPNANGILPDSRVNVPLLVVSLQWTVPGVNGSPSSINIHRIAKILAWEPGVDPNDPTLNTTTNYTSLVAA